MYLQTEDITPCGSGISWCCVASGKQGLTPRRTRKKEVTNKSHGAGWWKRNYERVKMSGETSVPIASLKPRSIQVYLHVWKDSFTVQCMSKLWYSPTNSTVYKPIRSEQITRAPDSSLISNLMYRREFYVFSCENPLTSSVNLGVSLSASITLSMRYPLRGPNISGRQNFPSVRSQIPLIGKEHFTITPQSLETPLPTWAH